MAAPTENIVWSEPIEIYKDGYWRGAKLGLHITTSSTDTQTTAHVAVWIWTKYAVDQATYVLSVTDNQGGARLNAVGPNAIRTYHSSGEGYAVANQQLIYEVDIKHPHEKSSKAVNVKSQISGIIELGTDTVVVVNSRYDLPALPKYTVSYNAMGGTPTPASVTVFSGETISPLPTVSRTGYKFAGWYNKSTGGTKYTSYTPTSNAILYAHWTANTYDLGIDPQGGAFSNGKTEVITMVNETGIPLTYGTSSWCDLSGYIPIRSGYAFLGFFTENGEQVYTSDGKAIPGTYWSEYVNGVPVYIHTGNLGVYAHWKSLANLFQKVNGQYKEGTAHVKSKNVWKEGKHLYKKINGAWTIKQ